MKRLCIALVSALLCISMIAPVHVMAAGNDVVYITDTGKKYHAANCSSLRKSKHAITLANAKASGYTPCSKCLGICKHLHIRRDPCSFCEHGCCSRRNNSGAGGTECICTVCSKWSDIRGGNEQGTDGPD